MATTRATSMNGKVLTWAREQAGLTADQLADLVKKDRDTVLAWEDGQAAPTLRQLESIASLLKRPLAVFFLPEPPAVPSPAKKFRSLPEPEDESEARDTSFALRETQARQLAILDLTGGKNPAGERFLFARSEPLDPARLRRLLGVSVDEQMSWPDAKKAFDEWRERLEHFGVIVFKRAFKQMSISGFCLPHDVAPVIVVNNSTTWSRQVFTLFHELCHLAHHHYGVTRADLDYLARLIGEERRIEVECNRFASEFLLPPDAFAPEVLRFSGTESEVEALARRFKVSREVVLRRLLDSDRVSHETYEAWTARWTTAYFARPKPTSPGGNYYATTVSYLGRTFLRLAFRAYQRGQIDLATLADHLGVKARNLVKLESSVEARS